MNHPSANCVVPRRLLLLTIGFWRVSCYSLYIPAILVTVLLEPMAVSSEKGQAGGAQTGHRGDRETNKGIYTCIARRPKTITNGVE